MLERELADLAVDSRPVDRDRLLSRAEGRNDRCHGHVVQRDTGDLGQYGAFPRRVTEASLATAGTRGRRGPGISLLVELGGIAVCDRLGQAAAVLLVTGASEISSSQSWGPS